MVSISGEWNWSAFQSHLPWPILLRIAALKSPVPSYPVDSIGWGLREDRLFTLKSAYEVRCGAISSILDHVWKRIQRFRGAQRIKIFLWLVYCGRLMTNVERKRRHFTLSDTCSICHLQAEDTDHVLRQCPAAKVVWIALIKPERLDTFLSLPFRDWFALNLFSSDAFARIMADWDLRSRQVNVTGSLPARVSWQPPDEGLDVAWSLGCRQLLIESDSSDALKAISRGGADYGRLALLRYILDLCNRDWIVSFNQVSRGNNGVADRLSKIALGGDFQVKRLDEPPMELRLATEVRRERLPKIHGQAMDGHNSEDSKQNTADMTVFVQNLLQQMQSRFQTMSDSIITKVDEMGNRINELEQSINDLKAEMGVEGSPSPLPPPNQTSDGAKQEEGSA
ncbi:hypothetical protein V6N13_146808 [Hibiscus sabdariffa]